jgi:hypothetical protein
MEPHEYRMSIAGPGCECRLAAFNLPNLRQPEAERTRSSLDGGHANRDLLGRPTHDRRHRPANGRGRLEPGLVHGKGIGRCPTPRAAGSASRRLALAGKPGQPHAAATARGLDRPPPIASGALRLLPHGRAERHELPRPRPTGRLPAPTRPRATRILETPDVRSPSQVLGRPAPVGFQGFYGARRGKRAGRF